MSATEELFAVSAPGAAAYSALELSRLALLPTRRAAQAAGEAGGVTFQGDLRALYRANLHLRTANRVLLRLGEFRAVGFSELRKLAARLPWDRYLAAGRPLALRVTCHKSRLYHSDGVAERIAAAVGDRLGALPPVVKFDEEQEDEAHSGEQPQLVIVRLLHDRCTVSIDTSGSLLHRRGYRLATAKAPLRETLAATMLLASGWSDAPAELPPLLDPFCGSGTIAIEAALLALGIAPGLATGAPRRFAFMRWPGFDAGLWQEVVAEARTQQAQRQAAVPLPIIGASDRDAGAVAMAQANAARAGVAEQIRWACRPVSALTPPPLASPAHSEAVAGEPTASGGFIVTNPPYGLRVSAGQDVRNLYAQFGKVLAASFQGWRVAILCADTRLLSQVGQRLDTRLDLVNGGLAVKLGRGRVGG